MVAKPSPFGALLRSWRDRRRLTQAELAFDADVSPRHLSFVETGRAAPSRALVATLAERLDMPFRDRNALLLAAGFAPIFDPRGLLDPGLAEALALVQRVLHAQEPYPSMAFDRRWNMVASNRIIGPFVEGVAEALLQPPVNLLRLTLHPQGMAPRILNLPHWRERMLSRLRRQYAETGDAELQRLHQELAAYPGEGPFAVEPNAGPTFAEPLRLTSPYGPLSFLTTTMIFGAPLDIELSELAIETFLPADAATATALRTLAEALGECQTAVPVWTRPAVPGGRPQPTSVLAD